MRGGYSAVPFAHIEIEEPGSAVVIPVAVFDAAGRRRYETGLLSAELFVFSVEPGSPADQIGLRRGDQIQSLDGAAAGALGPAARAAGRATRKDFQLGWISPGGVQPRGQLPAGGPIELDAYRQEEQRRVFGALNRLAWKTDPPVPITNRFGYALGHSFERTGQIIADDDLRLRPRSSAGACR